MPLYLPPFANPLTTLGDLIAQGPGTGGALTNWATPGNGASATVSTAFSGTGADLLDGNTGTNWNGNTVSAHPSATIDLGQTRTITAFRVAMNGTDGGSFVLTSYKWSISSDNATWTDIYTYSGAGIADQVVTLPTSRRARYWRFTELNQPNAAGGCGLHTLELQGPTGGAPTAIPAGADGAALIADSSQGTGLAWMSVLKSLGSQTVGTAQATIAHGLGYTPTVVIAQLTSAGQIWRSAAPDGTNVYLTADAAGRTCEVLVR